MTDIIVHLHQKMLPWKFTNSIFSCMYLNLEGSLYHSLLFIQKVLWLTVAGSSLGNQKDMKVNSCRSHAQWYVNYITCQTDVKTTGHVPLALCNLLVVAACNPLAQLEAFGCGGVLLARDLSFPLIINKQYNNYYMVTD